MIGVLMPTIFHMLHEALSLYSPEGVEGKFSEVRTLQDA
jgi:hypothetical protein